jgi:hypothetical protein
MKKNGVNFIRLSYTYVNTIDLSYTSGFQKIKVSVHSYELSRKMRETMS